MLPTCRAIFDELKRSGTLDHEPTACWHLLDDGAKRWYGSRILVDCITGTRLSEKAKPDGFHGGPPITLLNMHFVGGAFAAGADALGASPGIVN
jgi:hypothetical protein